MTVRAGSVVRAERQPPADCSEEERVYEVHECCAKAFALAPPV